MRSTDYASDPVDDPIIAPLTCGKALSVTLDNMQRHIDQAKHHMALSESQIYDGLIATEQTMLRLDHLGDIVDKIRAHLVFAEGETASRPPRGNLVDGYGSD